MSGICKQHGYFTSEQCISCSLQSVKPSSGEQQISQKASTPEALVKERRK